MRKKRTVTFNDLVLKNKQEILSNKLALEKIEQRIDEKREKEIKNA